MLDSYLQLILLDYVNYLKKNQKLSNKSMKTKLDQVIKIQYIPIK